MVVGQKKQQQQQKNSFIEYAKQHGIDEAYRKFKNMDGSLLEEAVKAYCDTLGLEYTSVKRCFLFEIKEPDSGV